MVAEGALAGGEGWLTREALGAVDERRVGADAGDACDAACPAKKGFFIPKARAPT